MNSDDYDQGRQNGRTEASLDSLVAMRRRVE